MPRQADSEERRTEVIRATMELVANEGPEALSMRKIAEKANCTIGLLNHWFANKDEIIEAVLDKATVEIVNRVQTQMAKENATFSDVCQEFLPLDTNRKLEAKVWLVFWALSLGRSSLRKGYTRRAAKMREGIVAALKERRYHHVDLEKLVDALVISLDGIAVNALVDSKHWNNDRQKTSLKWILKKIV